MDGLDADLVDQRSAGSVPTQLNHAGEVSNRRALAREPQRRAELVLRAGRRPRTSPPGRRYAFREAALSTMNAVPRGLISHL